METRFTPGPWHRNIKPARKYPTVWAGRNTHVAAVVPGAPWGSGNGCTMSDEEIEANIDLIAAAPDIYKFASQALMPMHDAAIFLAESDDASDANASGALWAAYEALKAALAKARGE